MAVEQISHVFLLGKNDLCYYDNQIIGKSKVRILIVMPYQE
jgi:hypothetical protein